MATYKLVNTDQLDADMKSVADKLREKSQIGNLLLWPSGFIDAADKCSSLNFAVVGGTTRPSNPQENTIWINTSTAIPKWSISPKQPSSPSSGTVWIQTETDGDNAFNAIKNNEIYLILGAAKQYVSGTWKDVDAQLYTGGKWLQGSASSKGILYEPGNQHTDITGGWGTSGWTCQYPGTTLKAASIGSTGMDLAGDSGMFGFAGTNNLIDLSNVDTIYANIAELTNGGKCWIGVNTKKELSVNGQGVYFPAMLECTNVGTKALSVKNMTSGYICVFSNVHSSTNMKCRVTEIHME